MNRTNPSTGLLRKAVIRKTAAIATLTLAFAGLAYAQ